MARDYKLSFVRLYGKVNISLSYKCLDCKIKNAIVSLKSMLKENKDFDLVKYIKAKNLYKFTQNKDGRVYYFALICPSKCF